MAPLTILLDRAVNACPQHEFVLPSVLKQALADSGASLFDQVVSDL